MPFLPPNQQRQSTEGKQTTVKQKSPINNKIYMKHEVQLPMILCKDRNFRLLLVFHSMPDYYFRIIEILSPEL